MTANGNGNLAGGDDHPHSYSLSSLPVAISRAIADDDNDDSNNQKSSIPVALPEDTPLRLPSPSSLTDSPAMLFFNACRPSGSGSSSQWGTDEFLACSPMVSGSRSRLRMPNLDLREARRVAAATANARLMTMPSGRSRSRSLGNQHDEKLKDGNDSSPLLLGDSILKRRTPSGLSLMDLNGDSFDVETNALNSIDNKFDYGATTETATTSVYTKPLGGEEITRPLKYSKSCSIEDRKPSPPPTSTAKATKVETDDTLLQDLKREFDSQSNPLILSLLYGLVNTSIVLPVIMSFGSIIYHDEFFRPYLSVLMKLTVVSGAVHQITFSTVSSLPFAVGQVQDAGLIFLSAMAKDLVWRLKNMDVDDQSILATVTIGLSLYTAVLGFALILIGKFKLASYCQLLPSSVVGGYLGYIGFFCGQAGLALMASVNVTGLSDWYKFLDSEALTLLAPGVIGGCAIYYSVRTFRHMAVLPSCIATLMIVFYLILWATNTTVAEATENGWINETVETPSWTHTWDFLKIEKVVWTVLPSQTLTLIAMISVVGLSSSLDIAAIEIELKRPLDYNHELKTVGISNVISGLTGGYSGSYIFSQTIFSLRMGIRSRTMGYVVAALALISVVIPINILSYIPNFFFGSLLMLICLDLMFEWLIDVRGNVTSAEYVIVLSTFALLQIFGVEFGIIGGIILYVVIQKMGYDLGKDDGKLLNEDEMAIENYVATPRNENCGARD